MVCSMTGFGRAQREINGKKITVEIRAVNHRYFDCTVKTPRAYILAEEPMKAALATAISRGKCEIFLTVESGEPELTVTLNRPVAEAYLAALRELSELTGLRDDLSVTSLARMPDVFTVAGAEEDPEQVVADILTVEREAIEAFRAMRSAEGERMAADVLSRIDYLRGRVGEVEERSPAVVAEYREKLENRIREILNGATVDEGRLLTEAALFADKTAVDEETVRLRSHFAQAEKMLRSGEPVGRKLDFLVQEMNRETNTIGSKANDLAIANIVVDMKAEIEKIREQIQNIE